MGNKTAQVLQDQGAEVALNNVFDEELEQTQIDKKEKSAKADDLNNLFTGEDNKVEVQEDPVTPSADANTNIGEVELPEVSPTNPVGYSPDNPEESEFYRQSVDAVNSITEIQENPIMDTEGDRVTSPVTADLFGLDKSAVTLINVDATTKAINEAADKAPDLLISKDRELEFTDVPTDDTIEDIRKRKKIYDAETKRLIEAAGGEGMADEDKLYNIINRESDLISNEEMAQLEAWDERHFHEDEDPIIGAIFDTEGNIAIDISELDDLDRWFEVDPEAYKYIKDTILTNEKFGDYATWEEFAAASIEEIQGLIRKDPIIAKIFANSNTILANESKSKFVDTLEKYKDQLTTPEGIETAQNEYDTWQKNRWNELILTNGDYNSRALQYEFAAHQVLKDLYVPFGRTKTNFLFDLDKDLAEGKISTNWWKAQETLYGAYTKAKSGLQGWKQAHDIKSWQRGARANTQVQELIPHWKRLGLENKTIAEIRDMMEDEEYWNSLSEADQKIVKDSRDLKLPLQIWKRIGKRSSDATLKDIVDITSEDLAETGKEVIKGVEQRMKNNQTLSLLSEIDPDATDFFSDVRRVLDQSNMVIMGGGMALKATRNPYAVAVGGVLDAIASVDIISQTMAGDVWATIDSKIRARKGEDYQPTKEDYLAELEDPESVNMFENLLSTGLQFGMERFSLSTMVGLGTAGTKTIASLMRGQFRSFITQLPGLALKRELAGITEYLTEGSQGLVSDANVRFQTSGNIMEAVSNAEFDEHGAKVGYRTGKFLFGAGVVVNQSTIELNNMALMMADRFNLSEIAPTWVNTERTFNEINDLIRRRVAKGQLSKEEGNRQLNTISNYRNQGMKIPNTIDGRTKPRLLRLLLQQSKLAESIKKTDNKDLSGPELLELAIVSGEIKGIIDDAQGREDYLKQVGNVAQIINANSKANVKIIKSKNAKGVDNQIEKLKQEGWKIAASKGMSTNYGTILQQGDQQVILLNEQEILKDGAINTAAHEFLHAVLWQTVKNSKGTAINLGNKLVEYLSKANPELMKNSEFKKRLQQYIDDPQVTTEQQAEEVLTLFSEAILDGAISEAEFDGFWAPVSDMFRRVWQSLGFGNIRFDDGKDVYNFIKDFNRSIKKGEFTKAQQTMFSEGATGDLVKRKYIKSGPGATSTVGARKGVKDPEEAIVKDSKKLNELTKDYKKDKNTADVLALTEQYTAASIDALQRWAAERNVPFQLYNEQGGLTTQGKEALSLINKEFADIMRTVDPNKASVTTYLDKAIGPRVGDKLVKEKARTGKQVSQDVLTEKGFEPTADRQKDFDETQKVDTGRKKKYATSLPIVKKTITENAAGEMIGGVDKDGQTTGLAKEIISGLTTSTNPGKVAQGIIAGTKDKSIMQRMRELVGKFGSDAYNNFVDKVIDQGLIGAMPVATIKRRLGRASNIASGLINYKKTGLTPTRKLKPDGRPYTFNKPVYTITKLDKEKLKKYYKAGEKRSQSLFSMLTESIYAEGLQTLKNDKAFMDKLQTALELKKSPLTALEFMDQLDQGLDQRTKEDRSLDVVQVKASKKRKAQDSELRVLSTKRDINAAQNYLDPKGKIIKPDSVENIQKIHERDLETVLNGDIGTAVVNASNFGNFGRRDRKGKGLDKDGNPIRVKKVKGKWPPGTKKYFQLMDGSWVEAGTTAADLKGINRGKFMPKTGAYYGKSDPAYEQLMKAAKENDNSPLNKQLLALKPKRIKIPKGKKIDKAFLAKHADQIAENQKALRLYTKILEQSGQKLSSVAPFITASYQATTGLIKISAGFKGASKRFEHGKGQKYNKGEKYREEHSPPASVIGASLLWAIKYNHVDITMDAIVKNYGQIQLSKKDDARIDNSGFAATLPEGMTIFDDNVDLARLAASGVNLNTIINPKTKETLVSEMGLGLNPIQAKNPSLVHYQNELVMAVVKGDITQAKASKHLEVSIPVNIAKNARVIWNTKNLAPTISYPGETSQQMKDKFENDNKTRVFASKKRPAKGISVFDFDDTLAKTKEKVIVNMPYYAPGSMTEATMELTPAEFAERALELEEMGASFDFSQFTDVKGAIKGPLADLALKRQNKFGSGDIFVLTARPQASAPAIKIFLDGIGLNIPIENITGLENGSPQAKADWVLQKTGEGYNDFYFADDQMPNVKAVKQILDQVDVKSDVVIAKASKKRKLSPEFNKILEETTGLKAEATYSGTRAQLEGRKKDKGFIKWLGRQLTITPSAEDFMGLMYDLIGSGKQGNRHTKWLIDNLIDPYNKAEQSILSAKVTIANDFAALKDKFPSLRSTIKGNPLMEKIGIGPYTRSHAMRVYIWTKQGMDIPGLSKRDQRDLVKAVEADSELNVFADEVILIQKDNQYPGPADNWAGGTIDGDIMSSIDKTLRRQVMAEFDANVELIFSEDNMFKLEALFGKKWVDALKDSLRRMKSGSNRPVYQGGGARIVNEMLDWLNGSVGAVMFLNVKSGLLQLISNINFVNWGDNNIYAAAKAFANQKQYWTDVVYLLNSDYLVNRRDGLKINVNEAELANAAKDGGMKGAIAYLLDKGFVITRIMDSLAIATGGATFYRNRLNALLKRQNPETGKKYTQAEAEAKAFDDFYAISEESQQSSNPSKISQQQASLAGRVLLAFQNVTMQYNRMTKKSIRDLYNRRKKAGMTQRESDMSNLSKIIYYTTVQNIIFNSLQQALFAMLFEDETEEEEKNRLANVANGMLDSLLFGLGFGGAAISTVKNVLLKIQYESQQKSPDYEEAVWEIFNISPVLDSKVRKLRTTAKTFSWNMEEIKKRGWSLDNPTYLAISQLISAGTNIPIDRVMRKMMNMRQAMDEETRTWQRVALILGWTGWSVGLPYWGLQSTIKKEAEQKEKLKTDYKNDIKKLKAQGYKKVMYRNLGGIKPDDIIELQSPAGTVVYYVKKENL